MLDVEIIEIPSSPSNNQRVSDSSRKSPKYASKGKQKMKDVEVIELTDNEDDQDSLNRLREPSVPSCSRSLTKEQLVIELDATPETVQPSAETRFADATPNSEDETGLQRSQNAGPEPELTHTTDRAKYKGKDKVDVNSMGKVSWDTTVAWNGIHEDMQLLESSENPIPGPSRHQLQASLSAGANTAGPSNLDALLGNLSPDVMVINPFSAPQDSRPAPLPLLETPEETMTRYVAQVLEIIPDVDPDHCATLVADHFPNLQQATVERVLHLLFEDVSYPKAKRLDKGKRKATPPSQKDRSKKKAKTDDTTMWLKTDRPFVGGPNYCTLALNQLQIDYPHIPKPYLREQLTRHNGLYAPTFFFLRELRQRLDNELTLYQGRPYEPLLRPHRPSKQKVKEDPEFDKELDFVTRTVVAGEGGASQNANPEDADDGDDEEDNLSSDGEDEDNGIECGCCFSKFRFDKLSQCPDAHLFCHSCLRSYASTLLGSHNPKIACMSQSQCTHVFPAAALSRVLPRKTYLLYERLIQAQEIASANLEGLEGCPFCEWKCVFDVGFEVEKLFRCGNEEGGCGVVSCRKCKKLDHVPKSCEEVEKDRKLDARHTIEEAMTQALVRDCPKCKKAFIKEGGCNKMVCPNCRTMSCYLCRQIITGYEHFNQNPHNTGSSSKAASSKCVLWDKDLEAMHATEVKNAAEKAIAETRALHPDVSMSDLNVDVPQVPKRQNRAPAQPQRVPIMLPAVPLPPPLNYIVAPEVNQGRRHLAHGAPVRVPIVPQARQRFHQHQHAPPQPLPPHLHPHPQRHLQQHVQQHQEHLNHHIHLLPAQQYLHQHVPDREAFAQAMMGQYQPVGGGVEIGGRMLRHRAGRAPGQQQQQEQQQINNLHRVPLPHVPPPLLPPPQQPPPQQPHPHIHQRDNVRDLRRRQPPQPHPHVRLRADVRDLGRGQGAEVDVARRREAGNPRVIDDIMRMFGIDDRAPPPPYDRPVPQPMNPPQADDQDERPRKRQRVRR